MPSLKQEMSDGFEVAERHAAMRGFSEKASFPVKISQRDLGNFKELTAVIRWAQKEDPMTIELKKNLEISGGFIPVACWKCGPRRTRQIALSADGFVVTESTYENDLTTRKFGVPISSSWDRLIPNKEKQIGGVFGLHIRAAFKAGATAKSLFHQIENAYSKLAERVGSE